MSVFPCLTHLMRHSINGTRNVRVWKSELNRPISNVHETVNWYLRHIKHSFLLSLFLDAIWPRFYGRCVIDPSGKQSGAVAHTCSVQSHLSVMLATHLHGVLVERVRQFPVCCLLKHETVFLYCCGQCCTDIPKFTSLSPLVLLMRLVLR